MKQFLVIAALFLLCGCTGIQMVEDLGRYLEKKPPVKSMRTDEERDRIREQRDRDREHRAAKRAETNKKWEDRTMSAQQMLNSLGYECGEPTGVIDEQTRIAAMYYQFDQGLEITGWINDSLVRHLETRVADLRLH